MQEILDKIEKILAKKQTAIVKVEVFGTFTVWVDNQKLNSKNWGRDKSIQLFQFLAMARSRKAMLKDQIVDKLWENDMDDQGFKVALHGINKALEPDRKSHSDTKFVLRNGHAYQLDLTYLFIDSHAFEELIIIGNQHVNEKSSIAIQCYRQAIALHKGAFLPDRIYEDWSSDERERLQLMFLGASVTLAELLLSENPNESIQLCQEALLADVTWEEAYRIQMLAYLKKGNRPMAIKTYQVCEAVLKAEFGIKPLPETRKIYQTILEID
ncbi:MAG: bacterial transcriptional activator domain-containing protein [Bacteroidota bacterium]